MYSKKRGIISLAAFAVLLVLVLYMAFHGFGYEYSGSLNGIKLGLDLRGGVSITYQAKGENEPTSQDMADTIFKLQQRVEGFSTEAQVYQEGSDRITIDIPGETDANEVLAQLGTPGTLIFCTDLNDVAGSTALDGNDITNASVGIDDKNNYIVLLYFTDEGSQKFADATGKIAGTGEPLYIVYDNQVISYPTCEEKITSPSCQISGSFTFDSASQLASFIRIGALPIELEELRSQVVGASLGSNAIQTSLIACVIGLILVIALLIVFYRVPGACASVALVAYVGLVIVIIASFNDYITLTLPGIAGIILSIGMAVDANVIIFSRLKEEIGLGNTVGGAINAGFKKALSAIVDGNVTTLIAALVLYLFGSGTVKGFAITLALGIVLSMFTALTITRLLVKSVYALGVKDEKWYGKTMPKKSIDFLSKKNIFFACSGAVIVIGILFMIINGAKTYALNYSLDFVGGTSTEVEFDKAYTVEELEAEVQPVLADALGMTTTGVVLTPVIGSNEVIVKTVELTQEQRAAMYDALEETFGVDSSSITYENISGTISAEMSRNAIVSVVLATIAMLLYIWIRFRDIRFAGSSVICLVHDALVVLACYAVFRWTVGNTFIACMLTLVGYSINATIVIFDRIRENLSLAGKNADYREIANTAVTQTLGRSINTSLTTLFMVAALYILGVTSIKEFALPLMVGILVGGYSSVCLASAIWYVFKTKITGKKQAK